MNIRILIILCVSSFSALLGVGILIPIIPVYAKDLGASGIMLGLIFSSLAFTMGISNPIVGRISDRIGFKSIIAIGLGLHVPVALLYVVAANPYHLIMIRLVEGVLAAMVQTATMAYAGSIAPKGREGSYMGVYNTSLFLGIGFGPLLGGYLTDAYNIHVPFYAMAAMLAISFILTLFLLPDKNLDSGNDEKKNQEKVKYLVRRAFSSYLLRGLLIFGFIIALGQGGLITFLPLVAQNELLTITQTGILTSIICLSAGVLQAPFGFLANRFNNVILIITGLLIVGAVLLFIPLCSGFNSFLILSLISGIGIAIANPAATALFVKGSRDLGLGLAFGLYSMLFGIGLTVGPILFGFIMDFFGLNQIFYSGAALFTLASFVIFYYTRKQEI